MKFLLIAIFFVYSNICLAKEHVENANLSGKYTISTISNEGNVFTCITALRDGKALVAGFYNYDDRIATMARILPNGELDESFQDKGNVNFTIDHAVAISIGKMAQNVADGSLIAMGNATMEANGKGIFVMKFTEDGTADESFIVGEDTGYTVMYNPFPPDESIDIDELNSKQKSYGTVLEYQQNNKILVGGYTNWQNMDNETNGNSFLAQLNADGSIDRNFGDEGYFKIDITKKNDDLLDILEVKDGYILLVTTNVNYDYSVSNDADIVLIKIDKNGKILPSFGKNGYTTIDYKQEQNVGKKLLAMPDGGILIIGDTKSFTDETRQYSYDNILLAKVDAYGNLDRNFGENGTLDLDYLGVDYISKVMLYDHKIMLIGNNDGTVENLIKQYRDGDKLLESNPELNEHLSDRTTHTFIEMRSLDGKAIIQAGKDNPIYMSVEDFNIPTILNDAILIGDNLLMAGQYGKGSSSKFLITTTLLKLNVGELKCQSSNLFVYPNPIKSDAVLSFSMCEAGNVNIIISDVQGKIVQSLPSEPYTQGQHEKHIQLQSTLPDGIYFITLQSANTKRTIKILKRN